MQASRPRRAVVVRFDDPALFLDFLCIPFTTTFAIILAKFFLTSTAIEMVYFFENEKFMPARILVISCLILIMLYAAYFYHKGRYGILMAVAREYFSSGRNNVLQLRSSFSWLRHLLAAFQPSPEACKYIHTAFKYLFLLCVLSLVSLIAVYLCAGKEIRFFAMNVTSLAIYVAMAFSVEGCRAERVLAHLGYSLLHVGTAIYYYGYGELSYICINAGVAVFILCLVWYFVNVPERRETKKRRRRP